MVNITMVQNYELYFILNAQLESKDISAEIESVKKILTDKISATNVEIKEEGIKKFAYPIKKYNNGFYVLANFDLDLTTTINVKELEKLLNFNENVIRYLIVNITEDLRRVTKQQLKETEYTSHRDLNKGLKVKKDIMNHMGVIVLDYKDADFLNQFTSPYAKIFKKTRTGTKTKNQRKVALAIKRARHMALMPFTAKHFEA